MDIKFSETIWFDVAINNRYSPINFLIFCESGEFIVL